MGKALKAAFFNRDSAQEALNELLKALPCHFKPSNRGSSRQNSICISLQRVRERDVRERDHVRETDHVRDSSIDRNLNFQLKVDLNFTEMFSYNSVGAPDRVPYP